MLKTTYIADANSAKPALGEKEPVVEAIEKHRVCYERWNEYEMAAGGVRTHAGYSLRLCGVNRHDDNEGDSSSNSGGDAHPVPGCRFCRETYADLRRVAEWILPKEARRRAQCRIEPFDRSFHIAPNARRCREEIIVSIQILHRGGDDDNIPADERQSLCLKEMCGKLKELGVLEGRVPCERENRR